MAKRPSLSVRKLASECFVREAGGGVASIASSAEVTVRKLRDRLRRVIGGLGFDALLRRSISLAKSEYPNIRSLRAGEDAFSLMASFQLGVDAHEADGFAIAVLANIVVLLATFVGETLTARFLQELWPELDMKDIDLLAGDEGSSS
jgi:hypothetical protein